METNYQFKIIDNTGEKINDILKAGNDGEFTIAQQDIAELKETTLQLGQEIGESISIHNTDEHAHPNRMMYRGEFTVDSLNEWSVEPIIGDVYTLSNSGVLDNQISGLFSTSKDLVVTATVSDSIVTIVLSCESMASLNKLCAFLRIGSSFRTNDYIYNITGIIDTYTFTCTTDNPVTGGSSVDDSGFVYVANPFEATTGDRLIFTSKGLEILTDESANSIKYYGDPNILPSNQDLFQFSVAQDTDGVYVATLEKLASGVTLPDNAELVFPYEYIDSIGRKYIVRYIGDSSSSSKNFKGNTKIKKAIFPSCVKKLGGQLFKECSNLTSVTFNGGVTMIGGSAFSASGITSITLPDTLETIGSSAFSNCSSLEMIYIPMSLIQINNEAFSGTISSTLKVYYGGNAETWGTITIGSSNSKLTNATRYYHYVNAQVLANIDYIAMMSNIDLDN